MNNKMSEKESFDFILGQITVLKYACATLIGMRSPSDREAILKLLKNISSYPIKEPFSEFCKRGIENTVEEIGSLSDVAFLAEQFRLQGIGNKS